MGTDANGYEYIGHTQAVDFFNYVEPEESEGSFPLFLNKRCLKPGS
jgi:hypothetical protein